MKFAAKTNSVDPLSFDIERLSFENVNLTPLSRNLSFSSQSYIEQIESNSVIFEAKNQNIFVVIVMPSILTTFCEQLSAKNIIFIYSLLQVQKC